MAMPARHAAPAIAIGHHQCPSAMAMLAYWSIASRGVDRMTLYKRCGVRAYGKSLNRGKEGARVAPKPIMHKPDPIALELWKSARPDDGTIVGRYLRNRGIDLAVPSSIRVTPTNDLIAAVQAPNGEIIAVQVTQLADGKKADVAIPRITTGALGLGAVRLDKAGDILGIAEGIETALSAMQIFNIPVWASLGAARMHRVAIPESVRELHIFGDNGDPGRAARSERLTSIARVSEFCASRRRAAKTSTTS